MGRRIYQKIWPGRASGWRPVNDAWTGNKVNARAPSALLPCHFYAQIANDVVSGVGLLRQGAPDTAKAFGSLLTAATATKALDTKTKELMALAIGIAVHCEGCVAYHTKMAHQHGAAREEVVETIALAVYMGGGPAAVYGGDALRAYDQFSRTQA